MDRATDTPAAEAVADSAPSPLATVEAGPAAGAYVFLVLLAWILVIGLCGYQTAAAGIYKPKVTRYSAKNMDFLERATKALVAENHPASLQALAYRADVIWRCPSVTEFKAFLHQAAFLRMFSDQKNAYVLLLNTSALLPGLLVGFLAGLSAVRWRKYSREHGFRAARKLLLGAVLTSGAGVAGAMTVCCVPDGYPLGLLHQLIVIVNLLEVGAWLATAGLLTGLILRVECRGMPRGRSAASGGGRQMPLMAVAVSVALAALLVWVVTARVQTYQTLAGERFAALRELTVYRKERDVADAQTRTSGYIRNIFDLGMLFYSKRDLTRSIGEIRADTARLRLERLNMRFDREIRVVAARLEALAGDVAQAGFTVQYRTEVDALAHRVQEMRRDRVPTLEAEQAIFAAITGLDVEIGGFSRRLASDRAGFSELLAGLREATDFDRLARLILSNYTDKQMDPVPLEAIQQEAVRVGPPFTASQQQVRVVFGLLRGKAEQFIQTRTEEYLHQRDLVQARQLLADASNRLSLRLPAQQRELERLEIEAKVSANMTSLQGKWQMSEADSGLTKNYALMRMMTVAAGRAPGTVSVEMSYSNTYKEGMLSKKKSLTKEWPAVSARVDVEGARLNLPDYQFSYDERRRGETSHADCILRLGDENRTLEVVVRGRVIYRLKKLHE